jgi:hypothetical protein
MLEVNNVNGREYLDVMLELMWQVYHSGVSTAEERGTLSICRSVVLPALSRPRKRSLAFLLRRPNDARTSQNQLLELISLNIERI